MHELCLTEVAGVVEHDVEDNLYALGVCRLDELLKHLVACLVGILTGDALVAAVDLREVGGVIAVVVVAGGILHYRGYPDCGEAQRLYIVELVDEAPEVTAPARVLGGNLRGLVVPA